MKNFSVGIDVGIIHLALVYAFVNLSNCTIDEVEDCELIDLTRMIDRAHGNYSYRTLAEKEVANDEICQQLCRAEECKIPHSRMICDRLEHFFACYSHILDLAVKIFVEQQPITGITVVEQFIMNRYRDKVVLISPTSMHKYFSMKHLDYDLRKLASIKIANEQVKMSDKCRTKFDQLQIVSDDDDDEKRAHDVSDAMLILKFGMHMWRLQNTKTVKRRTIDFISGNIDEKKQNHELFFSRFKYVVHPKI